jgi:hypothetical protein
LCYWSKDIPREDRKSNGGREELSGASERDRTSDLLDILIEAKGLVEAWGKAYNRIRPRSSPESMPPT